MVLLEINKEGISSAITNIGKDSDDTEKPKKTEEVTLDIKGDKNIMLEKKEFGKTLKEVKSLSITSGAPIVLYLCIGILLMLLKR
jgi:hypothetical protein